MRSHLMLNSLGELRICPAAGAIMEHPAIPGYAISSRSTVRGEQWRYGAASVVLAFLDLPAIFRQ